MSERIREDKLTAGETLRAYLREREPASGGNVEVLLHSYGDLLAGHLDGGIDDVQIDDPHAYLAVTERLNYDCWTGIDSSTGEPMSGVVSGHTPEMYAALRGEVTLGAFGQDFAQEVQRRLDFIHEQAASRISAT